MFLQCCTEDPGIGPLFCLSFYWFNKAYLSSPTSVELVSSFPGLEVLKGNEIARLCPYTHTKYHSGTRQTHPFPISPSLQHQQHVWCTKGIFWCTRHVGCFNACHVVLGWYAWWRLVVVSMWCTTGTFGAPKVYCGCLVHQRYVLVLNTFGAP